MINILPCYSRPTGNPHAGLLSIRLSNIRLNKLMLYRSYRIMITTDTQSSKATAKVRPHIKNRNHVMKIHTFEVTDPTSVLGFVALFINEADMLNISETMAFKSLLTFLEEPAEQNSAQTLAKRHATVVEPAGKRTIYIYS